MRRKLLGAAAGLVALALQPRLSAQEDDDPPAPPDLGPPDLAAVERRLASIERVLTERSPAGATPAAAALHQRLERFEYRLRRLESRVSSMRR